jgi:hypothetical protein
VIRLVERKIYGTGRILQLECESGLLSLIFLFPFGSEKPDTVCSLPSVRHILSVNSRRHMLSLKAERTFPLPADTLTLLGIIQTYIYLHV